MNTAMDNRPLIFFDDVDYQVRVLESDKFKETERLHEECKAFVDNISHFSDMVQNIVQFMNSHAKTIESEKLQALGLRNKVESEKEVRKKKQQELQSLISEKMAELERLQAQHESLLKSERESKALIDRLTNNDA